MNMFVIKFYSCGGFETATHTHHTATNTRPRAPRAGMSSNDPRGDEQQRHDLDDGRHADDAHDPALLFPIIRW